MCWAAHFENKKQNKNPYLLVENQKQKQTNCTFYVKFSTDIISGLRIIELGIILETTVQLLNLQTKRNSHLEKFNDLSKVTQLVLAIPTLELNYADL